MLLGPAAQRVNGCARTDRVGSILVGERRHRVVVDAHVVSRSAASPRADFGNDDRAVRFDGLVQCVAIDRRSSEQHAWAGQRRPHRDPARSVARHLHVAIGFHLPEGREQREDFRSRDPRNDAAKRDQAPGRSTGGIRSRDLSAEIVGRRHPARCRGQLVEQCAHARHVVGRHVRAARLQQVEQDDGRERRRHSPAHELTKVEKALVVGVRRARDDDARRVSETSCRARPRQGGEAGSGRCRGSRCASAAGVGPEAPRAITGRKPAARTISTGTDGHEATT